MRNIRLAASISLLGLLYMSSTTIFGSDLSLTHVQPSSARKQNLATRPEYAFSKRGSVFRVDANGRLSISGFDTKGEYYNDITNLSLLRVNPNNSVIYVAGQHYFTQKGMGGSFFRAYRLFPHARIRLIGDIALDNSDNLLNAAAFGARGRFLYLLTVHQSPNSIPALDLTTYRCHRAGRTTNLVKLKQHIGIASFNQADIVSDPSGRFVYITQPDSRTIKQYRVSASGLLVPLSPASIPLSRVPSTLVFPPSRSFLYVVSSKDNSLTQLRMNTNGKLQPAHFFRFGNAKRSIDPILAVSPNGRFLYVADDTLPITRQYAIDPNGTIRPLAFPTVAFSPNFIAVDLTSHFAYLTKNGVGNQELIYPYRISPDGSLIRIKGEPASDIYPVSLTFAQPH